MQYFKIDFTILSFCPTKSIVSLQKVALNYLHTISPKFISSQTLSFIVSDHIKQIPMSIILT